MKISLFAGAFFAIALTAAPIIVLPDAVNIQEKKAAQEAEKAEEAAQAALAEVNRLNDRLKNLGYDEKIEEATKSLTKAELAEADKKTLSEAEKLLADLREEYKKIKDKYPADDYDGKIAAIEKSIEGIGNLSYAEFLWAFGGI